MLIRHHHNCKVYVIECPPGSRVWRSDLAGESVLYIPWEGRQVPLFEQPGILLVELAMKGEYGLRMLDVEELAGG